MARRSWATTGRFHRCRGRGCTRPWWRTRSRALRADDRREECCRKSVLLRTAQPCRCMRRRSRALWCTDRASSVAQADTSRVRRRRRPPQALGRRCHRRRKGRRRIPSPCTSFPLEGVARTSRARSEIQGDTLRRNYTGSRRRPAPRSVLRSPSHQRTSSSRSRSRYSRGRSPRPGSTRAFSWQEGTHLSALA